MYYVIQDLGGHFEYYLSWQIWKLKKKEPTWAKCLSYVLLNGNILHFGTDLNNYVRKKIKHGIYNFELMMNLILLVIRD